MATDPAPSAEGGAAPPVRFALPPSLLEALRAHREDKRQKRVRMPPPPSGLWARLLAPLRALRRWLRGPSSQTAALLGQKRPLATVEVAVALNREEDVELLAKAFAQGMNDLEDEVTVQYDAFLLDPGMGPMCYLTSDGRILEDHRTWDGSELIAVTSMEEAIGALVVGAHKTGIRALLELIPALPDSTLCPGCHGERMARQMPNTDFVHLCFVCLGWGAIDERLRKLATKSGFLP